MSNHCPTPHISSEEGDFGKTVLMPGDPLRAEFFAKNFLIDARLVNNVRGVQGYTGFYKGVKVSIMASGMGMPSMGIYSHELFNFYGVENIIRVGSAGALSEKVHIRDLVFGMGACTNSNYGMAFMLPGTFAPIASYDLLSLGVDIAKEEKMSFHVGNLFSSDTFYSDRKDGDGWTKMGVLAVEMEAAALYMNAARAGKRALSLCTVSDSMITGEATTSEERQNSFTDMVKVALEIAYRAEKL